MRFVKTLLHLSWFVFAPLSYPFAILCYIHVFYNIPKKYENGMPWYHLLFTERNWHQYFRDTLYTLIFSLGHPKHTKFACCCSFLGYDVIILYALFLTECLTLMFTSDEVPVSIKLYDQCYWMSKDSLIEPIRLSFSS